jgi:hypothetical protein
VRRLLVVALVVAVAVGVTVWLVNRGHGKPAATSTTTPAGPTVPVQAYYFLGAALEPSTTRVPQTVAVASAATRALLAGTPPGYRTTIPASTRLLHLSIGGGTAHASFTRALRAAPRTAQGQIVYTLTQFPTVQRVLIDAGGASLPLQNGAGKPIAGAATRADYADLTPLAQIFVSSPQRDSAVTSPVRISGTASVFEAGFTMQVRHQGKLLQTVPLTATIGAPDRGTFDDTINLSPGHYQLVFFEPSAANGAPLHPTTVDITVTS